MFGKPFAKKVTVEEQTINRLLERLQPMRAHHHRTRALSIESSKTEHKESPPIKYEKRRRHSMYIDKKAAEKVREKYKNSRQHTHKNRKNKPKPSKPNKIQYRVKKEIFLMYDHYSPVKIIKSGAYAVVCEAINTLTGKKCAVKKMKGVFDHIVDARKILREFKLLGYINHQDILPVIDVIECEIEDIDTANDIYWVMPRMDCTLAKVIRSRQNLTNRHYQFFLYQILRGVNYLHSIGVIHRDLKPENILINGADCNVKITDFQSSNVVRINEYIEKSCCGAVTRWYKSPEIMCSNVDGNEKSDVWALGAIFGELMLRRPWFPGQNFLDQLKLIFEIRGTPKDLTWIKTPEAQRWVQKLKPHNGKALTEIFGKKATIDALSLLDRMIVLNPNKRYSALECMRHCYLKDLHRSKEEIICKPFELSVDFEKSIKTKFGARNVMYETLKLFKKEKDDKPWKLVLKNVYVLVNGFVRNVQESSTLSRNISIDIITLLLSFSS